MKRLYFILTFACLLCGCSKLPDSYNGYTCVTIDDVLFESSWQIYNPPTGRQISIEESHFDILYMKKLYDRNNDMVEIILSVSADEPLEIGKRYEFVSSEDTDIGGVSYDGKYYVTSKCLIIVNDIEHQYDGEAYITASFEYTATTEDGAETITVNNGRFYRQTAYLHK